MGTAAAIDAVGASATLLLKRDRDAIARAVTATMYDESPALLERYGEVGREKCLQDMHFTLEHLTSAMDIGHAPIFVQYVEWLNDLLRVRNVDTHDVVRCLELLGDECTERYPPSEAAAIGAMLQAGLGVLAQ